nr:MAG TPA: hypothetical protein [Caudoviricetes sp.]
MNVKSVVTGILQLHYTGENKKVVRDYIAVFGL